MNRVFPVCFSIITVLFCRINLRTLSFKSKYLIAKFNCNLLIYSCLYMGINTISRRRFIMKITINTGLNEEGRGDLKESFLQ